MRGPECCSHEKFRWEDREDFMLVGRAAAPLPCTSDDKPPFHPVRMRAFFVAALLTIFTSSLGILATLSQSRGGYKYDYATVPFLAEVLKFFTCGCLLWREIKSPHYTAVSTNWSSILLYPIPSIIYLVHNNVQFLTLTYVDTSTHQIMGNLKIVTTGILFRTFLKRKLSRLQWLAIMLLTVGTIVSQVKGCGDTNCGSFLAAPIQGYLLGVLSACLSAVAGIYTEYLMKKTPDSLYWQNMQLYAFGVLFNVARMSVDDVRAGFAQGPWWYRLLHGYNFITWLVVLNLACTGLLVSWVMKYADNIVKIRSMSLILPSWGMGYKINVIKLKAAIIPPGRANIVYATSMAMLLTMVVSIQLFDFEPTLQLFLGIVICCTSLQLYYTPAEALVSAQAASSSPPTPPAAEYATAVLDSEKDGKRTSFTP